MSPPSSAILQRHNNNETQRLPFTSFSAIRNNLYDNGLSRVQKKRPAKEKSKTWKEDKKRLNEFHFYGLALFSNCFDTTSRWRQQQLRTNLLFKHSEIILILSLAWLALVRGLGFLYLYENVEKFYLLYFLLTLVCLLCTRCWTYFLHKFLSIFIVLFFIQENNVVVTRKCWRKFLRVGEI